MHDSEPRQTPSRPNVTLVDTADRGGITRITEKAVVVGDRAYEVDRIIFATGFGVAVSGVLSGTPPVYGRAGRTLLEARSQGPRTVGSGSASVEARPGTPGVPETVTNGRSLPVSSSPSAARAAHSSATDRATASALLKSWPKARWITPSA